MDTYTPQAGNTIPSQGVTNLQGSLQDISGPFQKVSSDIAQKTAAEPQFLQQKSQQATQNMQIPQITDYQKKIADLYMHDQNMSQQFQNPNLLGASTQQPSDVPTYGSVGMPYRPVLTQQSNQQPFQGFTDPLMSEKAGAAQMQGALQVLNNLNTLISQGYDTAGNQVNASRLGYENNLSAEQGLANAYLTLMQIAGGSGSGSLGSTKQPRTEVRSIGGHDVLVDLNTGQIIQDYGPTVKTATDKPPTLIKDSRSLGNAFGLFGLQDRSYNPETNVEVPVINGSQRNTGGGILDTLGKLLTGTTNERPPLSSFER